MKSEAKVQSIECEIEYEKISFLFCENNLIKKCDSSTTKDYLPNGYEHNSKNRFDVCELIFPGLWITHITLSSMS